jgi:hypothetical protein
VSFRIIGANTAYLERVADLVCPHCRSTAVQVLEVIGPNLSAVRLLCSDCGETSVVGYPPLPYAETDDEDEP